jgi:hypothetical protein
MLILLPVLVFIGIFFILFTELIKRNPAGDAIRLTVVYDMSGCCLFTVLITEGLGVVNAINRATIIAIWSGTLVLVALIIWRKQILAGAIIQLSAWWRGVKLGTGERYLLAGISFYLVVLFLIAIISPPNNNDSLQYHMARIIHWIQNGNLGYFRVAYLPQLFNPPAAEILLMHNFLLVGGDQLVNLVQWTFMNASLVVVSLIAKRLGAGRAGQWFAVVFLLALPIGILEATSTQNDYVSNFFILGLASVVVLTRERKNTLMETISLGCLAGLAMLVKVAAYPYVAVILIWAILSKLKPHGIRRSIANSFLIISLLLVINLPGWLRSYQAFGNPLGATNYISAHAFSIHAPADLLISPVQHLSLNLGTPYDDVNKSIGNAIVDMCEKMGGSNCSAADSGEWAFRIIGLSNHEDTAGNLLHLILIISAIIVFVAVGKGINGKGGVTAFLITTVAGFILLSWLITWGAYWSRLQLPFFALAAPFSGLVFGRLDRRIVSGLVILLMVCGMPWLLMNRTRPVFGKTPDVTLVRSIFVETRFRLLFANYPELEDQIAHVTTESLKSGCSSISLKIDSRDPEYYFMAYLQPWRNDLLIETISDNPQLDAYRNTTFMACAQICSICGYDPNPDGLIFAYKDKAMTLYLSPEYYAEYIRK